MRKLLVIVLMLALVPFTTGCRIDGLWGFSNENATAYGTTTTTSSNLVPVTFYLPGTAPRTLGIRAGWENSAQYTFKVRYDDGTDSDSFTVGTFDATNNRYPVTGKVNTLKLTVDGVNYKIKFRIHDVKGNHDYDLEVKVTISYLTSASTTLTEITFGSINIGTSFTYTFTVKFTITVNGTSTTQDGPASTGTLTIIIDGGTVTSVLTPIKVVAVIGSTETELNGTTAVTGVDWNTPVFKVYFNQAITAPTSFTLVASGTDTTKKTNVTLTSAGGQLAVAVDSTGKVLVVTVTGAGTGANTSLTPGHNYSVSVTGTVVSTADSAVKYVSTADTYLFKTAPVSITNWSELDSTGAAMSLYNKTSGNVVMAGCGGFSFTFDYAMTLPTTTQLSTATFKRTIGTTGTASTLSYSSYFNTPTIDSTGKIITMTTKKAIFTNTADVAGAIVNIAFDSAFSPVDVTGTAIDTSASFTVTLK